MAKMTEEAKKARRVKKELRNLQEIAVNGYESSFDAATKERLIPGPNPTRWYKIGDRVRYGNWGWSAILGVYENGMYYKLVSVIRHTKRNIPDSSELKIHFLPWYDFTSYKSKEEAFEIESLIRDDDIRFYYSQRDLSSLMNTYLGRFGVDLEVDYQRGNVWKPYQKVDLIHSIFCNIDIGKFAIIRRPWGPDGNKPLTPLLWEMLDGKQRLTAIIEFYTGQFLYKGKSYDDLHPMDRHHFKYYSASIAETEPLTNAQKYRYFLKLNTTGTPVDPKHMAKVEGMLAKENEGKVNGLYGQRVLTETITWDMKAK
jgi:hypothetical protein